MEDKPSGDTGLVLYRRFLNGDEGAYRELIVLYEESLTLHIYKIVGNMRDAEDLSVDAFTALARDKGRFQGKSALKTYLFGIGRNLALCHIRERKNESHIPFEDSWVAAGEATALPEENLIRDERGTQLDLAMQKLKPEHRQVLRLLYFQNMSYAQAGEAMKKNERQIDGLAYRARTALKKRLESGGFTYEEN